LLDAKNSADFIDWESPKLGAGTYSLDFAVLSDVQEYDPLYVSKA